MIREFLICLYNEYILPGVQKVLFFSQICLLVIDGQVVTSIKYLFFSLMIAIIDI